MSLTDVSRMALSPAVLLPEAIARTRDWLDQLRPRPDSVKIPGTTAGNPAMITQELREMMSDEGVAFLRESYAYAVEAQ